MTVKTDEFDWEQFESVDTPAGKEEVFDWEQFETAKEPVSKLRSLLSAFPKGLVKGAAEIAEFQDPIGMAIKGLIPRKEGEEELIEKVSEKVLPTEEGTAESILERAGKLVPLVATGGESIPAKVAQLLTGVGAGELSKLMGGGETAQSVSEAIGIGVPDLVKGAGRALRRVIGKGPIEKTISGLPKLKAVEAKRPVRGLITPERKKITIQKLDEEATKLAEKTVKKRLPLSDKIKRGHPFETEFTKEFSDLKTAVEKFNPEVDVAPLSRFMNAEVDKLKGIAKLHPQGAKIKAELKAMRKRPITDMKDLYRIYRSNNKKMSDIFETAFTTGKQKEYVDFLSGMNKKIAESFKGTLPKDSVWMRQFEELNTRFKDFKNTMKSLGKLDPLLRGKATPAHLEKLAFEPKKIKGLELAMGKDGAKEIMQLAKDLAQAKNAVKSITARKMRTWDHLLPLSIFVPFIGKVAGPAATIKKGIDYSRRIYGYLLTTPKGRKLYQRSLDAIIKGNIKAFNSIKKEIVEDVEGEG